MLVKFPTKELFIKNRKMSEKELLDVINKIVCCSKLSEFEKCIWVFIMINRIGNNRITYSYEIEEYMPIASDTAYNYMMKLCEYNFLTKIPTMYGDYDFDLSEENIEKIKLLSFQ